MKTFVNLSFDALTEEQKQKAMKEFRCERFVEGKEFDAELWKHICNLPATEAGLSSIAESLTGLMDDVPAIYHLPVGNEALTFLVGYMAAQCWGQIHIVFSNFVDNRFKGFVKVL